MLARYLTCYIYREFESIERVIIPLLDYVALDLEPSIRRVFAEQLSPVAEVKQPERRTHFTSVYVFCIQRCLAIGGKKGYNIVVDKILPIVAVLLEDDKAEVNDWLAICIPISDSIQCFFCVAFDFRYAKQRRPHSWILHQLLSQLIWANTY